ncbi:MAG TPA: anti-sigma factor [Candidatus Limnocylindria bacterium]|nr:anti-sigma factor [Candidatus Limnocylindria bacterium]
MTPMDHAAAHERIEDLLLEPTRLTELAGSTAPADIALREHVVGCAACRADLEGWERLQRHLADALPRSPVEARASVGPTELPPSLRARVVSATRATRATRATERSHGPIAIAHVRSRRAIATWIGLAASLIVLTGAGVITVDQVARRAAAESEAVALGSVVAAVDRMLAVDHKVVQLETTTGRPAGTISWSRHDWVVLTTALDQPPSGQEYLCWLEADGRSVPVGHMEFAGGTAYWVATLDEWQTWEIGPTTRFIVTLEPAGAQQRTGETILEALLSS